MLTLWTLLRRGPAHDAVPRVPRALPPERWILLTVVLLGCAGNPRRVGTDDAAADAGQPVDTGAAARDRDASEAGGCRGRELSCLPGAVCDETTGRCVTDCADGSRRCGDACTPCPSGVVETACDGDTCIALECADGQSVCDGACCPAEGWEIEDTPFTVGVCYTSLALDPADAPHLLFSSHAGMNMTYATRVRGEWMSQRVLDDPPPWIVSGNVTVGPSGTPMAAVGDGHHDYHRFFFWDGGSAGATTVETDTGVRRPAIAVDGAGGVHLAFATSTSTDDGPGTETLRVARTESGTFHLEDVASMVKPGAWGVDLAVDSDGRPHISFHKRDGPYPEGRVRVAYARGTASGYEVELVDEARGSGETAIRLGPAGAPHIVYRRPSGLFYAVRTEAGWETERIPGSTESGTWVDMDLDSRQRPQVAYFEWDSRTESRTLQYAARTAPGEWVSRTLETVESSQICPSLAVDSYDRSIVLYAGRGGVIRLARGPAL